MSRVYRLFCTLCDAAIVSEPTEAITAAEMASLDRRLPHAAGCERPTRVSGLIESNVIPLRPTDRLFRCPCGVAAFVARSLAEAQTLCDLGLVTCTGCGRSAKAFTERKS